MALSLINGTYAARTAYSSVPTTFEVLVDGTPVALSAGDLLAAIENGTLTLQSLVRVGGDRPFKPAARFLRELVWLSYSEQSESPPLPTHDTSFRLVFEHTLAAMAVSDLTGRMLNVNQAFVSLLGGNAAYYEGKLVSEITEPTDHKREVELGNSLMRGDISGFQIRKRLLHTDGTWILALVSLSLITDSQGRPSRVIASALDLRPQLAAERQRVLEAENYATQQVAHGVAHDFSNLLMVIRGSAEFLRTEEGLSTHPDIDAIEQASRAAQTILNQLRILSSVGIAKARSIDLGAAVRDRHPLLERLVQPGQTLTLFVPEAPVAASLDELALEQILLNLVVNASQATPDDGNIRVEVRNDSGSAELLVIDTGKGMSEEVRLRALEPFFTSRQGGTGLGLSIVRAAVLRSGFDIDLQSVQGKGTTVRIYSAGRA